jgi:hypothetical protein
MATRAEHYNKAEDLLEVLSDAAERLKDQIVTPLEAQSIWQSITNTIEVAKIHATLANVDKEVASVAHSIRLNDK